MNLTKRQLATISVALAFWQANLDDETEELFKQYYAHLKPLTENEIDDLQETIETHDENCWSY